MEHWSEKLPTPIRIIYGLVSLALVAALFWVASEFVVAGLQDSLTLSVWPARLGLTLVLVICAAVVLWSTSVERQRGGEPQWWVITFASLAFVAVASGMVAWMSAFYVHAFLLSLADAKLLPRSISSGWTASIWGLMAGLCLLALVRVARRGDTKRLVTVTAIGAMATLWISMACMFGSMAVIGFTRP